MSAEPQVPPAKLPLVLLAAAGITFAWFANAFTPVNTDLGWMLSYGQKLLATGQFLHPNTESFTEPGRLVIRGDWLMCLLAYGTHHLGGGAGLVIAKWTLIALSVVFFALNIHRVAKSPLVQLVVVLGGVQLCSGGFELFRTQLATMVLLSVVVGAGLLGTRGALWTCVPVVALWCNAHGGATLGAGVVVIACVVLELEARLGWRPRTIKTGELAAISVLGVLALLCSPFAAGTLSMTATVGSENSWQLDREWIPLWRFKDLVPAEFVGLGLLAFSLVVCALWLPRRQLFHWVVLLLGVGLALSASRHLRIAPLLLGPAVASALDLGLGARLRRLERLALPLSGGVTLLLGSMWGLGASSVLTLTNYNRPSPANAILVMRANQLYGKVWNEFDWGGLLIWSLPQVKIAVDGRHLAAYSPRLLSDTINLGFDGEDPAERVLRYGAELVLLSRADPALPSLVKRFAPLYCDASACVLSRLPEHLVQARQGLLVPRQVFEPSALYQDREGPAAVLREAALERVMIELDPVR